MEQKFGGLGLIFVRIDLGAFLGGFSLNIDS